MNILEKINLRLNESKEEKELDTSIITSLRKLSQCDLTEPHLREMVAECFAAMVNSEDKMAAEFMEKVSPAIKKIAEGVMNVTMTDNSTDNLPLKG
jgi:hypothetical protein